MNCDILKNKTINDKKFLESMIVHHQVAIKMSEIISKSSTNDTILDFARNIIFKQSKEIFELYFLEKSLNNHWRNSFIPFKNYEI